MRPIPSPLLGDWLITDEGAELIRRIWETAQTTGKAERIALALEARDGKPFANVPSEKFSISDAGLAVIEIEGPLMRKGELFSDISGATSYQWISARAEECMDAAVTRVVLRGNSVGGEAAGCGECAEKLAQLAALKPVDGYVETVIASAAYWLFAQCTSITAHPTAQVGWIGAVRRLFDISEAQQKAGVREIELISAGAEDKRTHPLDKAVIARLQKNTNEWGQLFTNAVARGRGYTPAEVLERFGRGDGMFAAAGLEAGLVDAVGDFASVLSNGSPAPRPRAQGARMATKNDSTQLAADEKEWQCAGCSEMMGPSAKSFCAKCMDGDNDEDDEDEDEAKALGLDPKASLGARRARALALCSLEKQVLELAGGGTHEAAIAKLREASAARAEIDKVRGEGRRTQLRSVLERGLAGVSGQQPRLSLGMIQKTLATTLRGETKKSWNAAMDKVAAAADEAKATLSAAQIIEAACSVQLSADDLEAIGDFVEKAPPVAAAAHAEPMRNTDAEVADVDATTAAVKKAAAEARASLDRHKTNK